MQRPETVMLSALLFRYHCFCSTGSVLAPCDSKVFKEWCWHFDWDCIFLLAKASGVTDCGSGMRPKALTVLLPSGVAKVATET